MKTQFASLFGKYRDLVLVIGIFLLIDAGVAAINFHTSRQIEADARLINTAGLLRTYAQQLTKGLLTLDMDLRNDAITQSSLAEISEARLGFEDARQTLAAKLLSETGSGLIDPEDLHAEAAERLQDVMHTWEPIAREASPLIAAGKLDPDAVAAAVQKASTRNNRLTQQASDLTDSLERMARHKTSTVRLIQVIAISLAFLNFAFIVFKFIGKLTASDHEATEARQETGRILGSVREGLFLLTHERAVGRQHSASLEHLFGEPLAAGTDFHAFLGRLTSSENAEAAQDYIDLLFNPKMKQVLLEQLNPLKEVELLANDRRRKGPSHLAFEFDQIREGDQVVALLVSIFDISHKVRLERELAGAKARVENEIGVLLGVLDHNPDEVSGFLQRAREALQQINGELQNIQPGRHSYPQLINRIARIVHGLKGEAATLGCNSISREANLFEDKLHPLRKRNDLAGDDLIPVAVALSSLLSEIVKVDSVVKRVQHFANGNKDRETTTPLAESLQRIEQYALKIAEDLNKRVRFESNVELDHLPHTLASLMREAVPQLIRNAVAHGIESPEERERLGKPATGLIRIELTHEADGLVCMTVHDDGRGLSAEHLRNVLATRQLYTPEQIAGMSDERVIATIFEPGFSSLDKAGEHAGRGDGLALVRDALRTLGGRLRISSRPFHHTRFTLQFKTA